MLYIIGNDSILVRKFLRWNHNIVINRYIHTLYKSTQQFGEVREKFLQWNDALEKMNNDNKALLEEKFPTLDAPATVESLFPLRGIGYFQTDEEIPLDWGIVKELRIRK